MCSDGGRFALLFEDMKYFFAEGRRDVRRASASQRSVHQPGITGTATRGADSLRANRRIPVSRDRGNTSDWPNQREHGINCVVYTLLPVSCIGVIYCMVSRDFYFYLFLNFFCLFFVCVLIIYT